MLLSLLSLIATIIVIIITHYYNDCYATIITTATTTIAVTTPTTTAITAATTTTTTSNLLSFLLGASHAKARGKLKGKKRLLQSPQPAGFRFTLATVLSVRTKERQCHFWSADTSAHGNKNYQ